MTLQTQTNHLKSIPLSVWQEKTLSIDNFAERVGEATGTRRRFRVTKEQNQLIKEGKMTREEAFNQTVERMRAL
jgi:hypothetical protein